MVLFSLAATLILGGRRRRDGVWLTLFLAAVAVNFGAIGPAEANGAREWNHLAYVALAADPPLLLAFVVTYPYVRRSGWIRGLLATTGVAGVAAVVRAYGAGLDPPGWKGGNDALDALVGPSQRTLRRRSGERPCLR